MDRLHPFAVEHAADGSFYLLFKRRAVDGIPGFAAWRYPHDKSGEPVRFSSEDEVRAFAKRYLGAIDEEFAEHPGKL